MCIRDRNLSDSLPPPQGLLAALRDHRGSPCGLCGLGERSGEHLVAWCPAVGKAWESLCPPGAPPAFFAA
eukprot:3689327-Alexandrium_andersonii.AAC.1